MNYIGLQLEAGNYLLDNFGFWIEKSWLKGDFEAVTIPGSQALPGEPLPEALPPVGLTAN
ncbi:MAG: hypothetical protein MJA27_18095 [Pseudanabaenales cyanobacterium]|nr:hypothetical protein [Pseudanabaenales cyanobacterium]